MDREGSAAPAVKPLIGHGNESWDPSARLAMSGRHIALLGASWGVLAVFIWDPALDLIALGAIALILPFIDRDKEINTQH
jgi:hypothetical protein